MTTEPSQTTPYVFLSYATTDRDQALHIADLLEARGVSVWIDRKSIAGGTSWSAEIVRGIRGCGVFLVACSPGAMASPNVQQEIQVAFDSNRAVLPLLLERMEMPESVVYALAGRQWIEILDRPEETWLAAALRALSGLGVGRRAPTEVPTIARPSEPPSEPAIRHNLTVQLTSFIGRDQEIADVRARLKTTRLLTLTGTGGCGKTRLALEAAALLVDDYPDGVWLVELAPMVAPELVPQSLATVLGMGESPGPSATTTLTNYLKDRRILLILDNCEHLVGAVAQLANALLRACPGVRLLATSREALGVAGELPWPVSPLKVPDAGGIAAATGSDVVAVVSQTEAVRLFVERARIVAPQFEVTALNARSVAQICQRLDGIPLAIELAAARVRVLTVEQIASRLDDRFRLLTGGSRTVLERQRTLRALVDWSYDLLSEAERALFRRLAVFAGGWTLEAAERISAGDGIDPVDVLDLMTSLVDKSLVIAERQVGEQPYRMLGTLGQYAAEQLEARGESGEIHRRHATYYLELVETARAGRFRTDPAQLARLKDEHDNLRAAQYWAENEGDPELGARLIEALAWLARALVEAYQGTDAASDYELILARASQAGDKQRELEALLGLAQARYVLGLDDQATHAIESARSLYESACVLARELGDKPGLVRSLVPSVWLVDFWPELEAQAQVDCQEALTLSLELGDDDLIIDSQLAGWWYLRQADAEKLAVEIQYRLEQRRDQVRLNRLFFSLMWANVYWGQFRRAIEFCDRGFELARLLGVPPVQYSSLKALALIHLGRYAEARTALEQEVADEAHPFGRAMRDLIQGVYYAELGAFGRAADTFRAVAEPAKRLGRAWMRKWSQIGVAAALVQLGRPGEARTIDFSPSEKVRAGCEIGAPDVRAEILLAEGKYADACQQAAESARLAELRERRPDLVVAREVQVRSLLRLDRAADALALADATIPIARAMGNRPMEWCLEAGRARALGRLGDSRGANEARQAAVLVIESLANGIDDTDLLDGFRAAAAAVLPPPDGLSGWLPD